MMAELFGEPRATAAGRGGSMHIADVERGNLGATGIVAGNIPIATGAALAEYLKGTDSVVLCFFGDGATNTGAFHEALEHGRHALRRAAGRLHLREQPLRDVRAVPRALRGGRGHAPRKIEHVAAARRRLRHAGRDRGRPGRAGGARGGGAGGGAGARRRRARRSSRQDLPLLRPHPSATSAPTAPARRSAQWRERDPIELFARRLVDERALHARRKWTAIRAQAKATIEECDPLRPGEPAAGRLGAVRQRLRRSGPAPR